MLLSRCNNIYTAVSKWILPYSFMEAECIQLFALFCFLCHSITPPNVCGGFFRLDKYIAFSNIFQQLYSYILSIIPQSTWRLFVWFKAFLCSLVRKKEMLLFLENLLILITTWCFFFFNIYFFVLGNIPEKFNWERKQ